jgi:transposase
MPRLSRERRTELEAFWRFHHDEWTRGELNQREYCALHGLPLKRFGNWRVQFKGEEDARKSELLYRRGGLRHMSSHMADREIGTTSPGYIPSARAVPDARRNFSLADKRRIVAEASRAGVSVSAVARRHRIGTRLLFRWKQELARPPEPVFLPVTVSDEVLPFASALAPGPAPIIIERGSHEIEIELTGGRRVRFGRDADPQMVRATIAVLEGAAP